MIHPLQTNTVEQVDIDPDKKLNGYIWFNRVEKVYKTWVDGVLNVFLTNENLKTEVSTELSKIVKERQFTISFSEVLQVIIKHDKNTYNFNYTVFDDKENVSLPCSIEFINANEIQLEFVDPVTGRIFLYFE